MGKVKKLLSIFTAALVAVSLALSSGVASALSVDQIKGKIRNLVIHYAGDSTAQKKLSDHVGWVNLFSDVLNYAEVTDEDVTAAGSYDTQHWADWIMRNDGFKADPNNERVNLNNMLTNFANNEGYWQSNWRVKDDVNLLLDWGAVHYTVQNREGQEKPYKGYCYDEAKFLHKIREIYNLDPANNAQKYDALCLRALFRAMVEYDKFLGLERGVSLDGFVNGMRQTGLMEEVICLIANCDKMKTYLPTNEDFSLQDRVLRQNAVDFYKELAIRMIRVYYSTGDNIVEGQEKIKGRDYEIIFDDNGYVTRIEPIINPQSGNPDLITLKPGQGDKAGAAGGGGGSDLRGRIIKGTASGIDHFSAAIVALAVSASGIAGLGYVASRKRRKNVK